MNGMHDLLDYVSAISAFLWLVVGLFMKASLGDIKLMIAEVRSIIDTHVATDKVTHGAIERRLDRLEAVREP